jgi:hypothetical protein
VLCEVDPTYFPNALVMTALIDMKSPLSNILIVNNFIENTVAALHRDVNYLNQFPPISLNISSFERCLKKSCSF